MNLNEALSILKENKYLVEFLHNTKMLDEQKVIDRINKEFNAHFKRLNKVFASTDKNDINLSQKDISKIANIYSMYAKVIKNLKCNELPRENIIIVLDSYSTQREDRIFKPLNHSRLFLHYSDTGPDIIMRTGLRPKHADKDWEARIYLSSLGKWDDIDDNTSVEELADKIMEYYEDEEECYHYLIKLPENYPIINDPESIGEYEFETDWTYTLHSIPPQYILYLDGIDDHPKATKEDIIRFISYK